MPKNATPATKPVYGIKPMTALPKREAPKNSVDLATATALLDIVSVEGQTASDNAVHADMTTARAEANKAKRLLGHVLPDGKTIKTRVYAVDGGFEWAVYMIDTPAEAEAAADEEVVKTA